MFDASHPQSWNEESKLQAGNAWEEGVHGEDAPFTLPPESLSQRKSRAGIYPSKDSASWIEPYTQRDHAWNTDDYDQSNAATWKNHTKENNADYIDYIPALM
jgi:hypothetical protein